MHILEKYLENNRKVEMELIIGDKNIKTERTGFYKVMPDKYVIYRPQNDTALDKNLEVRILVYSSVGIFIFRTKIISLNSKLIEIEKPKNYKTVQRRELLRAELAVSFVIGSTQLKRQRYATKNISGSGFSFCCDEIFDKKDDYNVEIEFPKRKIRSKIKIIEIRKNLKSDLPKYRYSVKFLSLNNSDENYIIKQCVVNNIQNINI